MNQADLAQLAGTSRESVSRFLADLERAGIVRPGRGRVTVLDPSKLQQLHLLVRGLRRPFARRWSSSSSGAGGSTTSGSSRRWKPCRGSSSFPEGLRRRAYADSALPIGEGQTISQPWIVAAICQALRLEGDERVLEVGTGSGYSACVLARLAAEVISIERRPALAEAARRTLGELGVADVEVVVGDGSRGLPERAPFEAIAVHATAPAPPRTLLDQLAEGGRLVAPIASRGSDMLTVFQPPRRRLRPTRGSGPAASSPCSATRGSARFLDRRLDAWRQLSSRPGQGRPGPCSTSSPPPPQSIDLSRLPSTASMKSLPPLPMKVSAPRWPRKLFVAAVADQDVGAVGALEALVVAADPVGVAAAGRAAGAAELDPHVGVRAAVGDGVVAGAAVVGVALAGRRPRRRAGRCPAPPSRLSAPGSA